MENESSSQIPFPADDLPPYLLRRRRRAGRRSFLGRSLGVAAALVAPAFALETIAAATAGASSGASPALPVYLNRSEWGAAEDLRWDDDGNEIFPPAFYPFQGVTIHHSGNWTPADKDDAAALMRDIYEAHTVGSGYGDIGYQLAIGPEGYVYEGVGRAVRTPRSTTSNPPTERPWSSGARTPWATTSAIPVSSCSATTARKRLPMPRGGP